MILLIAILLCDSNILISKDKNFSYTSYKNLRRKIRSMVTFKELTIKDTCTTNQQENEESELKIGIL